MEHFYVTFGDPSCIGFSDILRKKTDTQTNGGKNRTHADCVGMGKNIHFTVETIVDKFSDENK